MSKDENPLSSAALKEENPPLRAPEKVRPFDEHGRLILDTTPVALPIDYSPPLSMFQIAQMAIRNEMFRREMGADQAETFDESDDFDTGDQDHMGDWEPDFDPSLDPSPNTMVPEILTSLRQPPPSDAPSGETPKSDTVPHGGAETVPEPQSNSVGDVHPKAPHLPS